MSEEKDFDPGPGQSFGMHSGQAFHVERIGTNWYSRVDGVFIGAYRSKASAIYAAKREIGPRSRCRIKRGRFHLAKFDPEWVNYSWSIRIERARRKIRNTVNCSDVVLRGDVGEMVKFEIIY